MDAEPLGSALPSIIDVYRHLRRCHLAGRGARLTADEVDAIWFHDRAVIDAVETADDEDAEVARGE